MSVRAMRSSSSSEGLVKEPILPAHNPPAKDGDAAKGGLGKSLLDPEYATSPVVAGAAYCCVSAAMVLLNKFALSGFDFTCPNTLLLFQCSTAVVFVKLAEMLGFWKLERLRWDIVQIWLPVNIFFVMMLATGVWSLQLLGVGMVTIMKNMTNLLTISGDYLLYGRTYNMYVWITLGLITGSALVGASTDLSFTWWGYTAQMLNCIFTAGYSLLLRGVMDKVKGILGEAMPTHSQVYYNNLLSLPLVCILAVVFGEPQRLATDPSFTSPSFHTVAALSCIVSFSISYSTLWFLSTTTPTTYGLVGSLNKIPVAVIGMFLFKTAYSTGNIASIGVGLLAGVLFVRAKQL